MKTTSGVVAALLLVLGLSRMANLSSTPEGRSTLTSGRAEEKAGAAKPKAPNERAAGCDAIYGRLARFIDPASDPKGRVKAPDSCYESQPPALPQHLRAFSDVRFAIAVVPNPVSTHLSLMFDRMIESIQHAAQDEGYSYDSSWFPWENRNKDYARLQDEELAGAERGARESQPGVIAFRRSTEQGDQPGDPFRRGLVIFVTSEQPTGGLTDRQFANALDWMQTFQAGPLKELRIVGPTFSGSLPSLAADVDGYLKRTGWTTPVRLMISSGTVSSGPDYTAFQTWVANRAHKDSQDQFWTAMENDSLMLHRFCEYLSDQHYRSDRIAILSEDETAFGGARRITEMPTVPCPGAYRMYYPRDIAILRSAYQKQSIFSSKSASGSNAPPTTLRGDLSEPDSGGHDTVRSYSGDLTPLAQESVLLDIRNRLGDKKIEFVIVRSTNSLDQIFLSQFLRRSYPAGRVVIDGADLLFSRGDEARSLRGVMILSTYPLLPWAPEWTSSQADQGYRTFGQDAAEGMYVAARGVFSSGKKLQVANYAPPAWAKSDNGAGDARPPTWLTVVARGRLWPVAALTSIGSGSFRSILPAGSERNIENAGGRANVLWIPPSMWLFISILTLWCALHSYFCSTGSILGWPRARTNFAPIPRPQQPALIALGTLLIVMIAVVCAAASGLFWQPNGDPFASHGAEWELTIALGAIALAAIAGCARNYSINEFSSAQVEHGGMRLRVLRFVSASLAVVCLAVFAYVHLGLVHGLNGATALPSYWRSMNLSSGVSGLLPQALMIAGAYLWFWCNLRGLAHFGDDRPVLPSAEDFGGSVPMPMFDRENTGRKIEAAAVPLSRTYLLTLVFTLAGSVILCQLALSGSGIRTLGERSFGNLILYSLYALIAVILADGIQIWRTWNQLRELLLDLDRLRLRRTIRALDGFRSGSLWTMTGNVLEQRYRLFSFQFESLRHLQNATEEWTPKTASELKCREDVRTALIRCREDAHAFADWYVALRTQSKPAAAPVVSVRVAAASAGQAGLTADSDEAPRENSISAQPPQQMPVAAGSPNCLDFLNAFQTGVARAGATAAIKILIPAWMSETESLICRCSGGDGESGGKGKDETIPLPKEPHVRAAEEFFVLPYLGFIQNILGRIHTMALGSLWLFIACALATASYPFDPMNVLGGIFVGVFVLYGGLIVFVYSQMSRDATLSHITNTTPGELGSEFWGRVFGLGIGPLIALLTALFPPIADFLFSWLAPTTNALK